MAATEKGVWDIQEVRDKQLASEWSYDASDPHTMWAWGNGRAGQLGQNYSTGDATSDRSSPIQVGTNTNWATAGGIKVDGTLWAWGMNEYGYCGQNSVNNGYSSPTQIPGTDWSAVRSANGGVSGGTYQSQLAVKTDGTLWAWGSNSYGNLGQNQASAQLTGLSSPTQVGTDTTWPKKEIENKLGHMYDGRTMMVIKTDGTLWSWGWGDNGMLCHNDTVKKSSPTQVGTDTNWNKISSKSYTAYAIKTDGTLWTAGYNTDGMLGQNDASQGAVSSPIQIPGTTWKSVTNWGTGATATKTDGTLWTWGRNEKGTLGMNDLIDRSSPVQVGTDTTWNRAANVGKYSAGALKTDGTLWTWGTEESGQLGQNTNYINISSPTQVGTDTDWIDTQGGVSYSVRGIRAV